MHCYCCIGEQKWGQEGAGRGCGQADHCWVQLTAASGGTKCIWGQNLISCESGKGILIKGSSPACEFHLPVAQASLGDSSGWQAWLEFGFSGLMDLGLDSVNTGEPQGYFEKESGIVRGGPSLVGCFPYKISLSAEPRYLWKFPTQPLTVEAVQTHISWALCFPIHDFIHPSRACETWAFPFSEEAASRGTHGRQWGCSVEANHAWCMRLDWKRFCSNWDHSHFSGLEAGVGYCF